MTSINQVRANRINARVSTGPNTAGGRARAAQNARRHGLSLSVAVDPLFADQVTALAHQFEGRSCDSEVCELAYEAALVQIDLARIRWARHELLSRGGDVDHEELAKQLIRIDRYERRALSRRKFAIRELNAVHRQGR